MAAFRLLAFVAAAAMIWLSVGSGTHGGLALHPAAHDAGSHMVEAGGMEMADDACCSDDVEMGSYCVTVLAVAPIGAGAQPDMLAARASAGPPLLLPSGRDPLGLLDPPRTV